MFRERGLRLALLLASDMLRLFKVDFTATCESDEARELDWFPLFMFMTGKDPLVVDLERLEVLKVVSVKQEFVDSADLEANGTPPPIHSV